MRQTSFADMHCSLARSLEVMGDWWSPLIIRDLWLGVGRFEELVEDLGISRNLLTARLAHLVAHGIVDRCAYQDHPARYDYTLAPAGLALVPVLQALTAWGDQWATSGGGAPMRFRHDTCDHGFTPTVACDHCGKAVESHEVTVLPGPGGRQARGTKLVAELLADRASSGARPCSSPGPTTAGLDPQAGHPDRRTQRLTSETSDRFGLRAVSD